MYMHIVHCITHKTPSTSAPTRLWASAYTHTHRYAECARQHVCIARTVCTQTFRISSAFCSLSGISPVCVCVHVDDCDDVDGNGDDDDHDIEARRVCAAPAQRPGPPKSESASSHHESRVLFVCMCRSMACHAPLSFTHQHSTQHIMYTTYTHTYGDGVVCRQAAVAAAAAVAASGGAVLMMTHVLTICV